MISMPLLLALFLAAAPPKAASPACSPTVSTRLDAPYVYATSVIDGLGWIKRGTSRMPTTGPRYVSEVLAAQAGTQEDFACACRTVKPFVRSESEGIRAAAESLVGTCDALVAATAAMAAALQVQAEEGDGPKASGAPSADDRMEQAIQDKNEAWGRFLIAAALSRAVLVELRDDSPTGRLLVTRAERRSLKGSLEKKFGKAIQGGRKTVGEEDPLMILAAGWYELLADPQFRALDDRS
jgi:hypothetical protein